MARLKAWLVFASGFLSLASAGFAADDAMDMSTGNALLNVCERGDTDMADFGLCYGYINGFLERDRVTPSDRRICVPDTASRRQIRDTVVAYLRANPAQRHLTSSAFAWVALTQAFPCESNAKPNR